LRQHRKYIIWVFAIAFVFLSGDGSLGQSSTGEESEVISNDSKREEVQRYFGYETLIYRYLSLPYDVSINVNQQGNYVDIGIIYILFFPILILMLFKRSKWLYWMALFYLLITWIISTSNSFIFSPTQGKINSDMNGVDTYLNMLTFSTEPFAHLTAYLYKFSLILFKPFELLGNQISGETDYVTYPIIFSVFLLVSHFLLKKISHIKNVTRFFIVFFWTYGFYWFAFSGGIVWYGYILLLSGLFVLLVLMKKLNETDSKSAIIFKNLFVIVGIFWIVIACALRTSDIQPYLPEKELGKGIFNPVFYDYGTGKITKDKSMDIIYSDISSVFNKINSENESLVWRVGTSFSYFVNNNNNRIIIDNQLGIFYKLKLKYPDNIELTDVLKANKIKYMIIDLNTASIDNTPDKSLTNKYRELLLFLVNNPYMKLLGTDRVVANKDATGKVIYTRNIFGEQIYQFGRYAIYELVE
jgi:hypothetical protein